MIRIVGKARRGFMLVLTLEKRDGEDEARLFNVEVPMSVWLGKTKEERIAYLKGQVNLRKNEQMWSEVEASVVELEGVDLEEK